MHSKMKINEIPDSFYIETPEPDDTFYIQTVSDLKTAITKHHMWSLSGKKVYAVDTTHECAHPLEFSVVKKNQHPVLRLMIFNYLSYYAVKKLDQVINEMEPEAKVLFLCPLCKEPYGDLWYPIYDMNMPYSVHIY